MNARELSQLTLQKDLKAIVQLPPPEESVLPHASKRETFAIAKAMLGEWTMLVMQQISLPEEGIDISASERGEETRLEGSGLWNRALLALVTYYDFAARRLMESGLPKGEELVPGLRLQTGKDLLEEFSLDTPAYKLTAALLTAEYLSCLTASYVLERWLPGGFSDRLSGSFEWVALGSLLAIHERQRSDPQGDQRILAGRLITSLLGYLVQIFGDEKRTWNEEHRVGPFSAIRLSELAPLARRDPALLKRFGVKHVERVFEQQLALIAQSLGLHVVSTRAGERTVDLVCISSDPTVHISFLLEAKTTARPYALPTKDSRALLEYIEEVRQALTTLPPLRFVLIVGDRAAKTLELKLGRVEAAAGVPIRFCSAQDIADLREAIPGPLPLGAFADGILSGPRVLPRGFTVDVAKSYHAAEAAHTRYVKDMLLSGIVGRRAEDPPPAQPWEHGQT